MVPLLIVVALTLSLSAMCSLFEATLYSTRLATLEAARAKGVHRRSATKFIHLKRQIAIPTAAIPILNTISNTAGATVAGMLAADVLGIAWIPVFSGGLTLAILLFAEILPKTYGATRWTMLWPFVVWPIMLLERLLRPLIWLTQLFASAFVRKEAGPATTEDEIIAMIRMGATAGELSKNEYQLLTAVFRFDETRAEDIMFPRRAAVFFDVSWSIEKCIEVANEKLHTRYPLCDGGMDNLLGLIHVKDLLAAAGSTQVDLRSLARPMFHVPETMLARDLLRTMRQSAPHMVAVVDELGTTVGLVTLENVLEQLVGSVQDEFDRDGPDIERTGEDTVVVRGAVPLGRLSLELDLELPSGRASTLSGLVVSELGRLPVTGDSVTLGSAVATVLEVAQDRATRIQLDLGRPVSEEGTSERPD